jgi:hypothetical protein
MHTRALKQPRLLRKKIKLKIIFQSGFLLSNLRKAPVITLNLHHNQKYTVKLLYNSDSKHHTGSFPEAK